VSNTATATGTTPGSDTPVNSPNDTVELPTPPQPGITVTKTATPGTVTEAGQTVTYSFLVTNTGNVTLRDIDVADTDFSGTGELSAIDCASTTLAAGAAETCTATYEVTQADVNTGSLTNSATATGTPPGSDTPLTPVPSDPVLGEIPRTPALSIVKTANADAATVGQTITYSFVVTNTGNVTITDPTVVEGNFSGSGDLSELACPTTTALQPREDITCTATYTVTQADVNSGALTNTATVTSDVPPGVTPPITPSSTSIVETDPMPALSLMKTANATKATTAGQIVTYSFLVENTGNVTITDPTVNEGEFNGHGTLSKVTCPSDEGTSFEPGDSVICTATYTVVAADLADGGNLSNTATVIGTTPGGDPLTSDPSTATVDVIAPVTPAVAGGSTPTNGELAFTGTDLVAPGAALALLLMALGGTFLVLRRRNYLNGQDDKVWPAPAGTAKN
jgi:uncharacterized repeat protein (TIGR01451 family)